MTNTHQPVFSKPQLQGLHAHVEEVFADTILLRVLIFAGFEWLYRVKQEPRRLWKRYLVTNVLFAWEVLGEFFRVRLFSREPK